MTIKTWLNRQRKLYDNYNALDAELILCQVLKTDRIFLVAHADDELESEKEKQASALVKKRFFDEVPLAYILRKKEFYGREFYIDERVLIPRAETELLVDAVKEIVERDYEKDLKIADVGTGSSCIATTLKLEIPKAKVTAFDISEDALNVAKRNAKFWNIEIEFVKTDLMDDGSYDIVVANLPYVDRNWSWVSPDIRFEPAIALFAEDNGLFEIKRLLEKISRQQKKCCKNYNTWVVLELDKSQKNAILSFAQKLGFVGRQLLPSIKTDYLLALEYINKN